MPRLGSAAAGSARNAPGKPVAWLALIALGALLLFVVLPPPEIAHSRTPDTRPAQTAPRLTDSGGDRYLPIVVKRRTPTPQPTPSATSTSTATATPTPTPPDPCAPIPGATYQAIKTEGGGDGRPARDHPDINLAVRGWVSTDARRQLVEITGPTDLRAPSLYDLLPETYGPGSATFSSAHQVNDWDWNLDQRGAPISTWPVTLIGMTADQGDVVRVPSAGYDIGTFATDRRGGRRPWSSMLQRPEAPISPHPMAIRCSCCTRRANASR